MRLAEETGDIERRISMAKGSRTPSGGYAQNWSAYNKAKTDEKKHFRLLLYELCQCIEQPEQARGRPRLDLDEVIFCIAFKIYSTYSSRKFMTDMDDVREMGFIKHVPHFNSLSHYLRMEWLTPVLVRLIELSSLPLEPFETNFAVDSTGFSTDRYARWLDERTQAERYRREWIKVHLICGVKTHIVANIIVGPAHGYDGRFFGRLVSGAARNFRLHEVSADSAYLSGENMRHAVVAGAVPFIAFKSTCRLDGNYKSMIWKRMLAMCLNEHGRFMAHYNKRNNVETTFSMIKANFGDRLRGRDERARINEALAKVLCHNLCVLIQSMYEVGITPTFDAVVNPDAEAAMTTEKPEPLAGGRIIGAAKALPSGDGVNDRKRSGRKRAGTNLNQLSLFSEEQKRS